MKEKINLMKNRAVAHTMLNNYINSVMPKLLKYFDIGNFKIKDNGQEFYKKDETNLQEIVMHHENTIRARVDVDNYNIGLVADNHYFVSDCSVKYIKTYTHIMKRDGNVWVLCDFKKLPAYTEKMFKAAWATIHSQETKIVTARNVISDIKNKFGFNL